MILKNKLFITVLTFCIFFLCAQAVSADACEESCSSGTAAEQQACLNLKTSCLQGKLSDLRGEKQTLTSTISILNGDISIQEVKVRQNNTQIAILEAELIEIEKRLNGLSISLDRLSSLLLERVKEQYRKKQHSNFLLFIQNPSLTDAVQQQRRLLHASNQTAQAMAKAEAQRGIYDDQKILKEEKQEELTVIKQKIEAEKKVLLSKKAEKQRFLDITQNDERRFQELLRQAEQQLASFRQFITSQGGASLLANQTNCDSWGCYYNQRDAQWGSMRIGGSSSSMAEYGCLVTSMAMLSSHLGKSLTPLQISASGNPFYLNTAFMLQGTWNVAGVSMTRTRVGYSAAALDSELAAGRSAIVGIGRGPDHFLVITKKQDGQYIMRDPYTENGKDIPFTSKYTLSSISAIDRITVQ